jgi:putative Mg2+ transporter-C (MgtC) family protein
MEEQLGINEGILRLLAAFGASLVYGVVRQRSGKPIGFGTFSFVAGGACALAITSMRVSPTAPGPLLGAIVTGIGFLGAGALVRTSDRVGGFTSAAAIWIIAVLGMSVGLGEWGLAGVIYGILWMVGLIDLILRRRGLGVHRRRVTVSYQPHANIASVKKVIGARMRPSIEVLEQESREGAHRLGCLVTGSPDAIEAMVTRLDECEFVEGYRVE